MSFKGWKVAFVLAITFTAAAVRADVPVPVSPGGDQVALISERCPTFSWSQLDDAESYELMIYRFGDEGRDAQPVLQRGFKGAVGGWTPALDECLERGGQYAWSVRAHLPDAPTSWSPPNLFHVAAAPSEAEFEEALEVVRDYLERSGEPIRDQARRLTGSRPHIVLAAPPIGDAGERGPASPTPSGPSAEGIEIEGRKVPSGLVRHSLEFLDVPLPAGTPVTTDDMACPGGTTVISGGVNHTGGANLRQLRSSPSATESSWLAAFLTIDEDTVDFTLYALCADI